MISIQIGTNEIAGVVEEMELELPVMTRLVVACLRDKQLRGGTTTAQTPKWMVVTPIKVAFTLGYPSPGQQWGRLGSAPDRRDQTQTPEEDQMGLQGT